MKQKHLSLSNKYGLHTRAAAKLVELSKKFQSKIELVTEKKRSDCKSIMALITLGAKKGAAFEVVTSGADEAEALAAVVHLIQGKFGEPE